MRPIKYGIVGAILTGIIVIAMIFIGNIFWWLSQTYGEEVSVIVFFMLLGGMVSACFGLIIQIYEKERYIPTEYITRYKRGPTDV